jgi:guanylate kinase
LESIFLAERIKTKRLDMAWLEENFILDRETKPADRETSAIAKGSIKTHG